MNNVSFLSKELLVSLKELSDDDLIDKIANKHEYNSEFVDAMIHEAQNRKIKRSLIEEKSNEKNREIEENLKKGKSGKNIFIGIGIFGALLIVISILTPPPYFFHYPGWGIFLYYGYKLRNAKEVGPYSNQKFYRYEEFWRDAGLILYGISFLILLFIFIR